MIAASSVVFSKNIRAIPLTDSALWQPSGKVGIISLCPSSGISLMRELGEIGITSEFLKERDIMHGFTSDLVDFDLIFIIENDNTSLTSTFRISQTARELSGAYILLVSSRREAQSLSKVFESVCDVVASFPIDKEKLSYVVRQLVNANNSVQLRVLGPIPKVVSHGSRFDLFCNLVFFLIVGAVIGFVVKIMF